MTNTRQFQVLTSSASNQADIFNNLVEVKDVITGQVGLLLCSHMCQWPEELLSQATWIEGCKTPEIYANDTRLAMGYHPDQYTQWRVFKETNTIELYLTGGWFQPGEWEEEITYTCGLPFVSQINWVDDCDDIHSKDIIRILRIFSRKTRDGFQEALSFIESVTHRLVNSGAITPETATAVAWYITKRYPDDIIHWEGRANTFTQTACEGGSKLFSCSNLMDDYPLGFSRNWGQQRYTTSAFNRNIRRLEGLRVRRDYPDQGYGIPCINPLQYVSTVLTVVADVVNEYAIASTLHIYCGVIQYKDPKFFEEYYEVDPDDVECVLNEEEYI